MMDWLISTFRSQTSSSTWSCWHAHASCEAGVCWHCFDRFGCFDSMKHEPIEAGRPAMTRSALLRKAAKYQSHHEESGVSNDKANEKGAFVGQFSSQPSERPVVDSHIHAVGDKASLWRVAAGGRPFRRALEAHPFRTGRSIHVKQASPTHLCVHYCASLQCCLSLESCLLWV